MPLLRRWRRAVLRRVQGIRSLGDAWGLLRWIAWRALWVPALQTFNQHRTVWWFLRRRSRLALAGRGGSRAPPTFDLRTYNPVHWRPATSARAVALGALDLLPAGTSADRAAWGRDPIRLRRHHHVLDVAAFHENPTARAGALAKLAAAGVVVHAPDADDSLGALLGAELGSLIAADPEGMDSHAREVHCIRMRRAALREHSSWARRSVGPPTVSILLATRRPALLSRALASVARQSYPRLELSLALHGPEDAFAGAEEKAAALPVPVALVRAPSSEPIGAVLNEATAASAGTLVTKMDDDDLYGAEHVWDLVLARAYSDAQVVAKGFEFVHLAASGMTVRIGGGTSEAYRTGFLAGGALMIAREDLARVGGWATHRLDEDKELARDVLRAGGSVYRTHGAGFMLMRHGGGHSWKADDAHFLLRAERVVPGCVPALADIDPGAAPSIG